MITGTIIGARSTALNRPLQAERMRSSPRLTRLLERVAGTFLIGFGIKLAVSH